MGGSSNDLSLTYHDVAAARLERLWPALFGEPCPVSARSRLDAMVLPWGAARIPRAPAWPSDIGDDHSPYEFSIAFDPHGPPSLRFLCEAQGATPTLDDTRSAALTTTARFGREVGVDLQRFEQVRDLFLPDVPNARFLLWHAATLSGKSEVKAYFNPQIAGKERQFELVEQAMRVLGFESAWPTLLHSVQRSPTADDEIRYFALDLNGGKTARMKVYLYQRGITTEHLERMAAACDGYTPGELTEFCRAMTDSTGPYTAFPLCTYLSFIEGNPLPNDVTVQIPIRFYASNDAVARDRISRYMRSRGIDHRPYEASLTALAPRALEDGPGLNTYASLRAGRARVTIYIATELFSATPHVPMGLQKAAFRQSSVPAPGKIP